MHSKHAIAWVDHHEARIVRLHGVDPREAPPRGVHPEEDARYESEVVRGGAGQTHNKRHDGGHRHPLDAHYADRVAQALEGVEEILICGPGQAKDELMTHLRERHPALARRVVAVEPMDHPTDAQLADHARKAFRVADRMRGVHVR